jgi:hypothetical protein
MAIHSVPQIQINGSNKIFNSYPYSLRYQISYGESPSTLQISMVSEDGKYDINAGTLVNTYCTPYNISIVGSQISLDMYLEDINLRVSPAGNILDLSFVDTSVILDTIHVGLYKRHGLTSTNNLIIVGKEISPCSDDPYGNPSPSTFFDPCHPCLTSEQQNTTANLIDCIEKAKYEILDVKYNFSDLLSSVRNKISLINAIDPNPKYLSQYTGSLRDVLNSWCRDFGWFFYWNNGSVVFKDLRNTINVNSDIENFCPNVLEYNVSYSMKESVKTATITNFSRPGDPAKLYTCQEARYLVASSLTSSNAFSMPLTISPEIDRVAAGLSYYNEDLRDLYYFYTKYQMYNEGNFRIGKRLEKLGLTILSNVIKMDSGGSNAKPLDDANTPSGATEASDSKVSIDPFASENADLLEMSSLTTKAESIRNNSDFYECVRMLDFETQWKIIENPGNYFFFFGEQNESLNKYYLDEEREFAGFLHKYAVYVPDSNDTFFEEYDFQLTNLCGVNYFVNTGNVSYNFLGDNMGNITFYNTSSKGNSAGDGTQIGELPFSKFLSVIRDSKNRQGSSSSYLIPFKLIVAERGRNTFVPDGATQSTGGFSSIRDYYLLDKVKKYLPYKIANKNNIRGEYLSRKLGAGASSVSSDVSLFIGRVTSADDFRLTEINGFNNLASPGTLFDGKPINQEQDPSNQTTKIVYQYPDLKCKIVGNNSFGSTSALHAKKIVFRTPLTSFEYTEPTDSLFGIIIEKTTKKKRIIKKVESFNSTNLSSGATSCNFAKLIVNNTNISDDTLRVLKKSNSVCQFDTKTIQKIHDDFSNNLALNYTQPTITKSFKVAGIELNGYYPSIDNGLISLQIGLDSSNGVYAEYEFGTRLMRLPNSSVLDYNSINMSLTHGSYTNTVNNYPLVMK